MSDNKGKDGEMMMLNIFSSASIAHNGLEVTRPSKTNSADLGADMFLTAPQNVIEILLNVASGNFDTPSSIGIGNVSGNEVVKARIDSKNYDNKVSKAAMAKFLSEVPLHADSQYHLIIGGPSVTKGAQKLLDDTKPVLDAQGIEVRHISDTGIFNLSEAYPSIRPGKPENSKINTLSNIDKDKDT
ncbi:hypothetical protein KX75_20565 [Salmonella enterica subsp. enterica]|nr:hypothetical protein [Salmonella enterica subsp. enterica serovar Mikawasima]EDN7229261.1 hypothetical protein [Salmonella enterica subsp. enterica serovar Mikawasima]